MKADVQGAGVRGAGVRAAGAADVGRVVEIEHGCETAPHWTEEEYRRVVAGVGIRRCLLVAENGRGVVGFAVGKVAAGTGEIESVAVAVEARRAGVGRALCRAVLGWCAEAGAQEVELEVRAGSGDALRMYEGLGFVEVGRRRGYYREPAEDAVLMRVVGEGVPG